MDIEIRQLLIGLIVSLLFAGGAVASSYIPTRAVFIKEQQPETSIADTVDKDPAVVDSNKSETLDKNTTEPETSSTENKTPAVTDGVGDTPTQSPTPTPPPTQTETLPAPEETITVTPTSLSSVNTNARAALVNILCISSTPGIQSITGSGVIVGTDGVILTNAHIAQYFLLEDYPKENANECVVRNGSPATARYRADLMYISPRWVAENRESIRVTVPMGTGENDFAFLTIKETTTGTSLPTTFPALPITINESAIEENETVLIASYPAGFLGGTLILGNLNLVSTISRIAELFTFKSETLDLFSTGGSIAAQQGSSGGAIVSEKGALIGIAVTATQEVTTSERDLRAITLAHIDRSLAEEGKTGIVALVGNAKNETSLFQQTVAPTLQNILIAELQK